MRYIIAVLLMTISISIAIPSQSMADSWYSGLIPGSKSTAKKGSSSYAKQRIKQRAIKRTNSASQQSKFVITGGGANTSGRLNYSPEKARSLARKDYEEYRRAKSAELDTKKVKIKAKGVYGGTKEVSLREFQKMQRESVRADYLQANAAMLAKTKKQRELRQKKEAESHRNSMEEFNRTFSETQAKRNVALEKVKGQSLSKYK